MLLLIAYYTHSTLLLYHRILWMILGSLLLCLINRYFLLLHYLLLLSSCSTLLVFRVLFSMMPITKQHTNHLDIQNGYSVLRLVLGGLYFLPMTVSSYHSPQADALQTVNVDSLFQHTTSRNQRVITQAVDFVVSMQTAPTCTRMAASHLMNECKLLEHAPDFAKSRPEAYLDNVKTEYAAKLAVCELLSAQPTNPVPPPHCDILVPASKHCDKASGWWHARPEFRNDKQCYPVFKGYQYTQCLESLQSTPQYWTSFSNARQNAVVMCQASRDVIERENHLETFKNLTQVIGGVTSTMQKTTEEYETLIREQRQYSEEARGSHHRLKDDIQAVQDTAVAIIGALDNKFNTFMKSSMSELMAALAESQNNEIDRIHQSMQAFSQDLMLESSQLAKYFTGELQQYHEQALADLQTNHEAQVNSYTVLSGYIGVVQEMINKTNEVADRSLSKVDSIAQRLDIFETQTEHIAEGFAFLSAIPALAGLLFRGIVGSVGTLFMFVILYRINIKLATYTAGACSSAFLLHTGGVFDWIGNIPSHVSDIHAKSPLAVVAGMSSWQKGAGIVVFLWLSAYPVCCINAYLGALIAMALRRLLGPLWFSEYSNDGGMGVLPGIEIPAGVPRHKSNVIFGIVA